MLWGPTSKACAVPLNRLELMRRYRSGVLTGQRYSWCRKRHFSFCLNSCFPLFSFLARTLYFFGGSLAALVVSRSSPVACHSIDFALRICLGTLRIYIYIWIHICIYIYIESLLGLLIFGLSSFHYSLKVGATPKNRQHFHNAPQLGLGMSLAGGPLHLHHHLHLRVPALVDMVPDRRPCPEVSGVVFQGRGCQISSMRSQ